MNSSYASLRPGRLLALRALLAVGLLGAAVAVAQTYSVDWWTIDGGGGTSTGGTMALSGTIGQPDAGPVMTGGAFSLSGGFWAMHAVQVEGAPFLSIESAGAGQALISWEPDPDGWILQEGTDLVLSNWVNSVSGSTNPVTVPASVSPKFYRLFKP